MAYFLIVRKSMSPLITNPREEKLRWWKPEGVPGVEILTAENSGRVWKIYHTTYTICAVTGLKAVSEWKHRGRNHVSELGSLMLIDCGEVHNAYRVTGLGTFWVLMISPELMAEIALEVLGRPEPHWKVSDLRDPAMFGIFRRLHGILASDAIPLEKESRLRNVLARLVAGYSEFPGKTVPQCGTAGLIKAREYLDENFTETVPLAELAGLTNLGKTYLCRGFAKQFGISPHGYQIRRRIALARDWLAHGAPFHAEDLGFSSQSQFSNCFKQVMGLAPTQYRRAILCK